ncbi:unnamed protein product, partial [marine sediment metagenome]
MTKVAQTDLNSKKASVQNANKVHLPGADKVRLSGADKGQKNPLLLDTLAQLV